MIHRESGQLFLGPYAIDSNRNVRVISPKVMPGRLTGNARHLQDPANKIYYATMEEGFYEVDVHDLGVTQLYPDANQPGAVVIAGELLPGAHGKGLFSGQGRLIYANNGEYSELAMTRPDISSGALASWDGRDWTVVRRNQFTEVTGPGGLYGNADPGNDPIWSIGWDHKSLILMLLDRGRWHSFRLPKASHSYDGAHGWYTEWPRIRDIGETNLLMTMHGMFWRFPRTFRRDQASGIAPRSTYLKVIGDFCRWNDRLVFGCDDAARSEFLNKRKAKGALAAPAQSQSNLWFVNPDQIDHFGSPIGRGGVWVDEEVKLGQWSEPFLFAGFQRRGVHLAHQSGSPVIFHFEVDRKGDGSYESLRKIEVPPKGYRFWNVSDSEVGEWIRVSVNRDCRTTVWFEYRNNDPRSTDPGILFDGLASATGETAFQGALLRAGEEQVGLQILASQGAGTRNEDTGYYELDPDLRLIKVDFSEKRSWMADNVAIPTGVLSLRDKSVLYIDDLGNRFRLPIGNPYYLDHPELLGTQRADREVSTERDLFQCAGTFFELPAQNAGGFWKIRPISSHRLFIHDYCSWRGLLVLSGVATGKTQNRRIIRSEDGKCAVWLGALDDLWELGKVVGSGGPWYQTAVQAGIPSDQFLMAGYDRKQVKISHQSRSTVRIEIEVDLTGSGGWQTYRTIQIPPDEEVNHPFPDAFSAYWIRFIASRDCVATAQLQYD
jgi:hypothetical protein